MIGSVRIALIGIFLAGVCAFMTGVTGYLKGRTNGRAEIQHVLDKAVAEADAAALLASEKYRALDIQRQADKIAAEIENRAQKVKNDKAITSIRAAADNDVRQLRAAFTNIAASGGGTENSSASGSGCAATAGRLLGETLQVAGELAGDAERAASAYRAMLDSWPVNSEENR